MLEGLTPLQQYVVQNILNDVQAFSIIGILLGFAIVVLRRE